MGSSHTLTTVRRAFEVLDLLWETDGITPNRLAEEMDLPLSTAHSYLHTLAETDCVDRVDGLYEPGYRFFTMGNQLKYRKTLFHEAKPVLQRIANETDETAVLHVEYRDELMILHFEEGSRSVGGGIYPGIVAPLHTQAGGKVILAHLSRDRVRRIAETEGLERITKRTITDLTTLRSELEAIRERGYGVDWDQQIIGVGMVAAPLLINNEETSTVRGTDVDVLGSVGVISPTGRLRDEDYRSELINYTREAADTIVVNYQYEGRDPISDRPDGR